MVIWDSQQNSKCFILTLSLGKYIGQHDILSKAKPKSNIVEGKEKRLCVFAIFSTSCKAWTSHKKIFFVEGKV